MYLDKIKQQLIELKLTLPIEQVGCTRDEVILLEQQLRISLPTAYQEFLLSMGHGAGKFLQGSDCFFQHLLSLQEWAVELLKENNFPKKLPDDAFVFYMHQGYQFSFFRLSEGDDPPTYSYCEGTNQTTFIKSHKRFSDFLKTEVEIQEKYLMSLANH
jgi:SMI1-KNR4 cell-wall